MTSLAEYLHDHITRQRWTHEQAARHAHISQTHLTNILNNKRRPSKEILAKIADGWGLSLDYMLELVGLPRERASEAERATAGLTQEQLAFLERLSPEQRRRLIDAARQILGGDTPS